MRALFIGTVTFSYHTLSSLIGEGAEIIGVITKVRSDFNTDFKDLAPLCKENNIEYKYVRNINHENNISWIREQKPDLIFCLGWSQILSREILNIPRIGVVGYHPAKLPYNRGRHPLIWALALGLKETASTFFFMDEGADTGDIISQEVIQITELDDAGSLYNKMIDVGCRQVVDVYNSINNGSYARLPQVITVGNSWRKRSIADGKIDWRMSGKSIYNLVRALTRPYPGAHFEYNGENITVWRVSFSEDNDDNIEPGKVILTENNTVLIKCGGGKVLIKELEPVIEVMAGDYL